MDKLTLPADAYKLAGLTRPNSTGPAPDGDVFDAIAEMFPHLKDKSKAAKEAFEANQNRDK